jgi:hypothetical protein
MRSDKRCITSITVILVSLNRIPVICASDFGPNPALIFKSNMQGIEICSEFEKVQPDGKYVLLISQLQEKRQVSVIDIIFTISLN